ncbi:MAG: hypothetical protein JEZ07_18200 [Phycisphaerae bacterium]|nr:hypothetical protein [Phycisphaerae bacterium]
MAAIIHYLVGMKGPSGKLGDWLVKEIYSNVPAEAMAYFRDNYFKQ